MISRKLKLLQAIVVGKSGSKTVLVEVYSLGGHSKYQKVVKRRKKIMVHDEYNSSILGQAIFISSIRPKSKNKSWKVFSSSSSFELIKKGVMNDSK